MAHLKPERNAVMTRQLATRLIIIACTLMLVSCNLLPRNPITTTSPEKDGSAPSSLMCVLYGCRTIYPVPQVLGGSAGSATVTVGYARASWDFPVPDWEQGSKNAAAACRRWGYADAVPMGSERRQCTLYRGVSDGDGGGCAVIEVARPFQCVGSTGTKTPIE